MFTKTNPTNTYANAGSPVCEKSTLIIYRGFTSIDQEMEREIAMQRFLHEKIVSTQRGFLIRDRG